MRFGAGEAVAWVVSPPGGVVQLLSSCRGTRELASWLVGPALQLMLDSYPGHDDFIILLDLTEMQGREPAARTVVMDRARELGKRARQSYIVLPRDAHPVYIATLHAAAALLSGFGVHIQFEKSAAEVVQRLGLEVSAPRSR